MPVSILRNQQHMNQQLGGKIRQARKQHGLSLQDLAGRLGLSLQQLQKYEAGQARIPAALLPVIAYSLRLPLPYLFEGLMPTAPQSANDTNLMPFTRDVPMRVLYGEQAEKDVLMAHTAFRESNRNWELAVCHTSKQVVEHLAGLALEEGCRLPHLLLLGDTLPDVSCDALLQDIYRLPRYRVMPVVILSRNREREFAEKCYRLGAAGYLLKDAREESMKKRLHRLLDYWCATVAQPY